MTLLLLGGGLLAAARAGAATEPPGGGALQLVSVGLEAAPANEASYESRISANGNFVLFNSLASNLVTTDTNDAPDIFLRNMADDTTERISRRVGGGQLNDGSGGAAMTPDARYFTFHSYASNVVLSDTNGFSDIFFATREDLRPFDVERISLAYGGEEANGDSFVSDLSDDGLEVVFDSLATNLRPLPEKNTWSDVFWLNRTTGAMEKLSISNNNSAGNGTSAKPQISGDGEYAFFYSEASNLVVADTNGMPDIFRVSLDTRNVELVSVTSGEQPADAGALPQYAVSADGRYIVFASDSTNLVAGDVNGMTDIFLRDMEAGETTLLSVTHLGVRADGPSYDPTISADGQLVGFRTAASTLLDLPNEESRMEGVFIDRRNGWVRRVATTAGSEGADGEVGSPQISDDGRFLAFHADASNLLPGDTNEKRDIFRRSTNALLAKLTFAPLATDTYQAQSCLTTDSEPNNTIPQADAKGALCSLVVVDGRLFANDADDYYRIEVNVPAAVTIELFNISPGSDFDLYLYNSSLGEVASSRNNGNVGEQIGPMVIGPGTYYIRVYPDPTEPGGARSYRLRWSR